MSAEVVKKRGRPKKVISDLVEVEMPDLKKKSTTRAKSTKAVPKATKTPIAASAKTTPSKKGPAKPIESAAVPKATVQPSEKPAPVKAASELKTTSKPAEPSRTKAEPPPSKILEQVRELESKKESSQQTVQSSIAPKTPPKAVPVAKSTSVPPSKTPAPSNNPTAEIKPSPSNAPSKPSTASPPPPKPTAKPHVPLAALNSDIVSNISTRAGARPNAGGSKELPKNYKSVAKKVRNTIVALPILIGTSYILYQRFVLGEERKSLIPAMPTESLPAPPKVESSKVEPPSTSAS